MRKSNRFENQAGRDSWAIRFCHAGGRLLTYFLLLQTAAGASKRLQEQAAQSSTPALLIDPLTNSIDLVCPPGARTIVVSTNLQSIFQGSAPSLNIPQASKDHACELANFLMEPGEKISVKELEERAKEAQKQQQQSSRFEL